jgi:two-component system response regulator PilR (NtrC family)
VRELENILERALALADGDILDAADLYLPHAAPRRAAEPARLVETAFNPALDDPPLVTGALPGYIEQMERAAIQKALEETRWNKTKAAEKLGITFRALRYKLKKLGME